MTLARGSFFSRVLIGIDLLAKIANLNDGIVRFRDLVPDLEKQIELFGQILLTDFQPRISLDLKRRGVSLA